MNTFKPENAKYGIEKDVKVKKIPARANAFGQWTQAPSLCFWILADSCKDLAGHLAIFVDDLCLVDNLKII